MAVEAAPAVATTEPAASEPTGATAWEALRALESELSALMDACAVPDWKVNPAFHADVNAFIEKHANNSGFVQKARWLQQNRARFYAKMRELEQAPMATPIDEPAPEAAPAVETVLADTPAVATAQPEAIAPASEPSGGSRIVLRLVRIALALIVLLVGLTLVAAVGYRQYGKKQLDDAVSETNLQDRDWQWASLQVNRVAVPDEQNAAPVVLRTAGLLPEETKADALAPLYWWLVRDRHRAALEAVQPLEKLPTGRYADSTYQPQLEKVCWLLRNQAWLLTLERQPDRALASWRALWNASRSMGDEPGQAQQQRIRLQRDACRLLEGILAWSGAVDEPALASTQGLVASEIDQPVLTWLLRGQRAAAFEFAGQPEAADATLAEQFPWTADTPDACKPALRFLLAGQVFISQADQLRQDNERVKLAALPAEELALQPDLPEEVREYLDYQAILRCTLAGLAAERYRLAHQDWPTELAQLVPEFLDKVPTDPYDGKPLRLKRGDGELVVYSLGPDRQDQEGKRDDAADVGCRLLDLAKRQPAPEK